MRPQLLLANSSSTDVVLEVKVRLGSVPAGVQIVNSPAELGMQIGCAGRVASLYFRAWLAVLVAGGVGPFWKSDSW